jgi:beta-galactosidase
VPTFTIGNADFLIDGAPHRILSGAIHYFRVHPDQWADRIHKARLMGLNTIETYVAWNAHVPRRGEWDATGWNDLGRFLDLIAAEGLHAIVRPGPYICAEWHNGGLPVWLTSMPDVGLRRSDPRFVEEVARYLSNVYEIVVPRQFDRGGPVVLVQIENEYGAYGNDQAYLAELVRLTGEAGITVPLTTIDQPEPQMLRDGSVPGVHLTASFGSRVEARLAELRAHQSTGPLMCAEFWDGWFDWWGGVHHTTSVAAAAAELDALLAAGASVNIYMFHGGTNFGHTNGANDKWRYLPIVTSYDYDAPLDEAGNPTEKFFAFRDVIARYAPVPDEVPEPAASTASFSVPLLPAGRLLPSPASGIVQTHDRPPTFEELEHLGTLVLYRAPLDGAGGVLTFEEVRDQAWIWVDGRAVGSLSRTRHETALELPAGAELVVLVEEQGRVDYGQRLGEPKGLIGTPRLDGRTLDGWSAAPVALEAAADDAGFGPVVHRAEFELDAATDLFLDTAGWGKGTAFINGFELGRYWSNGPQGTLFVPAPATRAGHNELVVIELEAMARATASFVGAPQLGPVEE